ncbi:HPF/RaiA family ribosome-associated protein [bacterium]|nr:MAG: HPF/RaiA family ribosome-associated protein [bacterium]
MEVAPRITLRNMEHSEALEGLIGDEIAALERFYERIITARIAVEYPHRHRERGNIVHVRIDIVVPGEELVITHEPSLHGTMQGLEAEEWAKSFETEARYKDAYLAVREAFHKARRVLEDYVLRMRDEERPGERATAPQGRVVKIDAAKGFGFLEAPDGREIYFHRDSVLDGAFKRLKVGSTVRFAEEEGEKGPQASTVRQA